MRTSIIQGSNPVQNKAYYTDKQSREKWLLEGDIDKPAYFICRITDAEPNGKHPEPGGDRRKERSSYSSKESKLYCVKPGKAR